DVAVNGKGGAYFGPEVLVGGDLFGRAASGGGANATELEGRGGCAGGQAEEIASVHGGPPIGNVLSSVDLLVYTRRAALAWPGVARLCRPGALHYKSVAG